MTTSNTSAEDLDKDFERSDNNQSYALAQGNNHNPDDLAKSFHRQIDNTNDRDENCSIAALEDKLVSTISSFNTAEINEDGIHIKWLYLDQANALIYRINVYDPLPEFIIFTGHIPQELSHKLDSLSKVLKKKIVTDAVRRIYESVDPEYFHVNGIYGKVRWRFAS